ncbi:hypothetical protein YPPY01_1753, partial [Yersinia pestis PY-01]
MAPPQRGA